MASRNFYHKILTRVLLLLGNALLIGWFFFGNDVQIIGIFFCFILILQTTELIYFLNRTNRQIAFFFDAVRNDDSTLNFPEKTGNRSINELNSSLNNLNDLIKHIKFDLEEQEQYYRTILEQVSVGIITYNSRGNIFLANTSAKRLLQNEHLNHIDQLSRIDKKLFLAVKEIQPGDNRLVSINSKNGLVQLSLKATHFNTASENLTLVTIQDVKNEMESQELESWIKLIRVLTHEIMNTVAPITSLSQSILGFYKNLDGNPPSEKVISNTIKGLEVINERGTGLISFVETYRKLTRIPQPDKKTIRISQLFEQTLILLGIEANTGHIQIDSQVNPGNLEISADKKQISQVLINLLKNAVEALKNTKNGQIKLAAGYNENGRIEITVSDNGPGISDELTDKIFIPFFTTKESGSGIGLSLSRQIMLLHGGSLKVKTQPGSTAFTLLF